VILLWASAYSKAIVGRMTSPLLRFAKPVLITLMFLFGILEVVLRIIWRTSDPTGVSYRITIFIYSMFVLTTITVIMIAFLFYGLRMYWNLYAYQDVNPLVKERLKRITSLTMGATILCMITFICILGSLLAEMMIFDFDSMVSFLVEQFIFRFLEISLVCLILFFLRTRTYQHGSEEEERLKLVGRNLSRRSSEDSSIYI